MEQERERVYALMMSALDGENWLTLIRPELQAVSSISRFGTQNGRRATNRHIIP